MGWELQCDEIGCWSEIKLDIIREDAQAYSKILAAQKNPALFHVYIDAFSGAGVHITKATKEFVTGSRLNALNVFPTFRKYSLIDVQSSKVESLRKLIGIRPEVAILQGNCNEVLLQDVFPQVRYEDCRRGLCTLDPYGLVLDWNVTLAAGKLRALDVFLNFPVMGMNRAALWRNPEKVDREQVVRMNTYWGDESWREIAYCSDASLFGEPEKQSNEVVAEAFRQRLRNVAGFAKAPEPLPMQNSACAVVYYFFFASPKGTAEEIVRDIFRNTKIGEYEHVLGLCYRVDRRDVEPCAEMHKDQPRLQALLRGNVCGALSRRQRTSL